MAIFFEDHLFTLERYRVDLHGPCARLTRTNRGVWSRLGSSTRGTTKCPRDSCTQTVSQNALSTAFPHGFANCQKIGFRRDADFGFVRESPPGRALMDQSRLVHDTGVSVDLRIDGRLTFSMANSLTRWSMSLRACRNKSQQLESQENRVHQQGPMVQTVLEAAEVQQFVGTFVVS